VIVLIVRFLSSPRFLEADAEAISASLRKYAPQKNTTDVKPNQTTAERMIFCCSRLSSIIWLSPASKDLEVLLENQ
jgi:hypothetical protein